MPKPANGQAVIARRKQRGLPLVKAAAVSDEAWARATFTQESAAGEDVSTSATDGQQNVSGQHLVADAEGSV